MSPAHADAAEAMAQRTNDCDDPRRSDGTLIPVPKRTSAPVTQDETQISSGDIPVSRGYAESEPVSSGRDVAEPDTVPRKSTSSTPVKPGKVSGKPGVTGEPVVPVKTPAPILTSENSSENSQPVRIPKPILASENSKPVSPDFSQVKIGEKPKFSLVRNPNSPILTSENSEKPPILTSENSKRGRKKKDNGLPDFGEYHYWKTASKNGFALEYRPPVRNRAGKIVEYDYNYIGFWHPKDWEQVKGVLNEDQIKQFVRTIIETKRLISSYSHRVDRGVGERVRKSA